MKIFKVMPKDWNLSKKLTTLMLTIFLGGIIVSSVVFYDIVLKAEENQMNTRANILLSTMESVRKYNDDKVTPLLEKQSSEKLLLESIPSYAVREVFDIFKTDNQSSDKEYNYEEYSYKDAMINPTNLKDKATEEETNIINKLSQQDKLLGENKNIVQGFLMINGQKKFFTARPIKITQVNCLSCHVSLEKSPKSLQFLYQQGKYGANQGFGWELNKVIGTKIIYVPADQVYKNANQRFFVLMGVFSGIFALAIFLVNLWLKQYVVRPINRITKVAEAVSLGDMNANFEKQYNDEVGRLADAFTRMKTSLEIAIKRLVKRRDGSYDELD